MGAIHVHEFMTLDGVIDAPTWTFEYGFDPQMGETLAAITARSTGILLGRNTYQMFEPAWSSRTAEDDPGAPFFNDTTKYVVSRHAERGDVAQLGDPRRLRRRRGSGSSRTTSTATSTSAAASSSCGRCWPTGWSTSSTCSSIRSRVGSGPRLFAEGDAPPSSR